MLCGHTFIYVDKIDDIPIPDNTHATGAKTSIKRTITPYAQKVCLKSLCFKIHKQ